MKTSLITSQALVIDDLFSVTDFKKISEYSSRQPVRSVHADGYAKVWTIDDGTPYAGPNISMFVNVDAKTKKPFIDTKLIKNAGYHYPTGTVLDKIFDKIVKLSSQASSLLGKPGYHWSELSAKIYKYPFESGINWHNDSDFYRGAFTYYTHAEWKSTWGGELLVSVDKKPPARRSEFLEKHTDGIYISPKPNRLVLIKGGSWHKVTKVRIEAGRNMREALSGFFKKV